MPSRRMPAAPGEQLIRERPVRFTFDGRTYEGFEGDTVGSALAAAGVDVLSRSFKYHRRRGLVCCSGRCPNCMVEVDGTPNVRACITPVREGMHVKGENAWPSVRRDFLGVFDRLDRVMPVGFYYKTFIRPRFLWPVYEGVLRRLAGLGKVDINARPETHSRKFHLHCDVAVVGGGPAGCRAALDAAAQGQRVVLIDDQPSLGGHLRYQKNVRAELAPPNLRAQQAAPVRPDEAASLAAQSLAELVAAQPNIQHLANATAFGIYEGKLLGVSRGTDMYRVRAQRIVVATGAAERPVLFQDNDRPGVMLGSAVLRLARLYGVRAGERAVVVTDDDHGWRTSVQMIDAGIVVTAVVDSRSGDPPAAEAATVKGNGAAIYMGARLARATGRRRVSGVVIDCGDGNRRVRCDLVAVACRPDPVVALLAHEGVMPRYDASLGQFVPVVKTEGITAVGDVLGMQNQAAASATTMPAKAGIQSAAERPDSGGIIPTVRTAQPVPTYREPLPKGRKAFVCICEDVTVKDIRQAVREGFDNIETLKRYSTVTMGPCQGKMCHALAAGVHAAVTDQTVAETGLTTARPPFQPVKLAALAGPHLAPVRLTAIHENHEKLGAKWMDMGEWKRPLLYTSVEQECRAVHEAAGAIDVSTLGKLELRGAGAGAFLDWLHPNRFSDLRVGRVRYRAMCDDAGIVLDDGTVARLGPDRFFVTTATGTLDAVEQWLRWWLAGSGKDVQVTNVTSEFAAINLAGPRARDVMARLTDMDVSAKAMPYLAALEGPVAGVPAVILRIGFVGELGYEIHVPADYGAHLWDAIFEAGRDMGIEPFGIEAQRVLRLEKQHLIVGQDTDALSNPLESGLDWLIKSDKPDFIGRDASAAALARGKRSALTGFVVVGEGIPAEGSAIVVPAGYPGVPSSTGRAGSQSQQAGTQSIGRVTSCKWSPTLKKTIGMGWIPAASVSDGTELTIRLGVGTDGWTTKAVVHTKPFYDPEGARLRM